MKTMITLFFFTVIFVIGNAQETILKQEENGAIKEEWEVFKKKKKIKHGIYRKWQRDACIIDGQYQNNKATGIWTYKYPNGTLSMIYDFDTDSILDFGKSKFVSKVKVKGVFLPLELDRPPTIIGGHSEIQYSIFKNVRYPKQALTGIVSGFVTYAIIVNEIGEITDYKIAHTSNSIFDKAAFNAIAPHLSMKWFPAKYQGKNTESIIELLVRFNNLGIINRT